MVKREWEREEWYLQKVSFKRERIFYINNCFKYFRDTKIYFGLLFSMKNDWLQCLQLLNISFLMAAFKIFKFCFYFLDY